MTKLHTRGRGFTLIEVLVVMVISSLLLTVLIAVFSQSRATMDKSTRRLDLTGRARVPVDRATDYLSSAVATNGFDGIQYPRSSVPIADITNYDSWPQHLIFATTEDFASTAYVPERVLSENGVGHYIFNSPTIYYYALWFESDNSGPINNYNDVENRLMLSRLSDPGFPPDSPAFAAWALNPWANLDKSSDVQPKALGVEISDVRFNHPEQNIVHMRVETEGRLRRASGNNEIETYNLDSIIQLPALSI